MLRSQQEVSVPEPRAEFGAFTLMPLLVRASSEAGFEDQPPTAGNFVSSCIFFYSSARFRTSEVYHTSKIICTSASFHTSTPSGFLVLSPAWVFVTRSLPAGSQSLAPAQRRRLKQMSFLLADTKHAFAKVAATQFSSDILQCFSITLAIIHFWESWKLKL